MILAKLRLLGLAMGIVTLLTLTACGASSVDATDDGGGKDRTETVRKSEPAPPADFVRDRCREWSCRVFSGKTGYCSRPACKHHWKKHRS